MDQARGFERMIGPLAMQISIRDALEIPINQRNQLFKRSRLSLFPIAQ